MSIFKAFSLASFPPVTIVSVAKNSSRIAGVRAKRGPKTDKEHSLDSPTELLQVKLQLFSEACYGFSSLLGERLQPRSTERKLGNAVFKGKRRQ